MKSVIATAFFLVCLTANAFSLVGLGVATNRPSVATTVNVGEANIPSTLLNNIAANMTSLLSNTNQTNYYNYLDFGLGTNKQVWTWPVNLSCVGIATNNGPNDQCTLLSSNLIISAQHIWSAFAPSNSQFISFKDTNGTPYYAYVTNAVYPYGDFCLLQISNAAPNTFVFPSVLPANYTNFYTPKTFSGIWPHRNSNHLVSVTFTVNAPGAEAFMAGTQVAPFGFDGGASSGDSSSPCFTVVNGNPVILGCLHTAPGNLPFISDPVIQAAWFATGLTNGVNFLNLNNYLQLY